MTRSVAVPGGALEHAVFLALLDLGRATAREVYERVGGPAGLVYTTTAVVLDRLRAKGLVSRTRVGRAFLYRPRVSREVVERRRARQLLDRLMGQEPPQPALAALVGAVADLDPALLDELARAVAARRRSRRGP